MKLKFPKDNRKENLKKANFKGSFERSDGHYFDRKESKTSTSCTVD